MFCTKLSNAALHDGQFKEGFTRLAGHSSWRNNPEQN